MMGVGEAAGAVVGSAIGLGLLVAMAQWVRRNVPGNAQALADREGVDVDTYALARVCASEAGGQPRIAKAGVAWVVVNEANRRGKGLLEVVLGSAADFGSQGEGGRGFVTSAKAPQTIDLEIAEGVRTGEIADPTDGALNFDSPRSYKDKVDAEGNVVQTKEERIAAFQAGRESEGKELLTLEGVSERTFRFWRRA